MEEKKLTPARGGDRGHARDRPRRPRHHPLADRRLPARGLHGRHRRPLHELVRRHHGLRHRRLAARQLHADADDVLALARADEGREAARHAASHARGAALLRARRARLHAAARLVAWRHRWVVVAGRWSLAFVSTVPLVHRGEQELPAQRRRVAVRGHRARARGLEPGERPRIIVDSIAARVRAAARRGDDGRSPSATTRSRPEPRPRLREAGARSDEREHDQFDDHGRGSATRSCRSTRGSSLRAQVVAGRRRSAAAATPRSCSGSAAPTSTSSREYSQQAHGQAAKACRAWSTPTPT